MLLFVRRSLSYSLPQLHPPHCSTFSTFIIFIPVFLVLYLCVCAVGCGFCCLSNVSTDMLDEEVETGSTDSGSAMMQKEKHSKTEQHSAEVPTSYKPPVSTPSASAYPVGGDIESNTSGDKSNQYGTFSPQEQQQQEQEMVVTSADVEVDID